jgi:hypothetical protein
MERFNANHRRQPDAKAEVRPPRDGRATNDDRRNAGPRPREYVRPLPPADGQEGKERPVDSQRQSPHELLRDLAGRLVQMQNQLDRLGPFPPIWEFESQGGNSSGVGGRVQGRAGTRRLTQSQREQLAQWALADLRSWVKDLRRTVADRPSPSPTRAEALNRLYLSKHRHEIAILLERAMQICADAASPGRPEAHDLCRELLDLMTSWGLNWQQRHIDSAIEAASRVGRWDAAAHYFEAQIDPDRGNRPVDVRVAEPVGLYALARHWQESNAKKTVAASAAGGGATANLMDPSLTTVTERLLDAVNRMSMLSPTDQESYLLAAGTALGRTGEWRDLVRCLRTDPRAEDLGQVRCLA